jgi:hypothetical protein
MNQTIKSSVALLGFAGLVSALVSSTVNLHDFELFFVGLAFGVALAGYFVLYEGNDNWAKMAGFVCACTAAYAAAFFFAVWLETSFPHAGSSMSSAKLDIPMSVFFAAGFVGAVIVFTAGVFLFGSRHVGWKSLGRVLLWSLGGGVLGAVGGAADGIRTNGTYHQMLLLFLVWQPGAAVLLGLLLSRERKAFAWTSAPLPSSKPSAIRGVHVVSIVFFAGVLGFLGLLAARMIQSGRAEAQRTAAYKRAVAEAPPIVNLAAVKAVPPEQALIVREIGGLFPWRPNSISHGQLSPMAPADALYSVGYTATKDPPLESFRRIVAVEVTQLPDPEWANYRIKYPRLDIFLADDSVHLTKVTKFGQTIVQDTRMRYPNGEGTLCFRWPSSMFAISVCYETPQVNEEFIRQYLAKYPSSFKLR